MTLPLLDEICHEWAARAMGLAREQYRVYPSGYPLPLTYWPPVYNEQGIVTLANRIIRTRLAQDQQTLVIKKVPRRLTHH
jgi:hypothetical protein